MISEANWIIIFNCVKYTHTHNIAVKKFLPMCLCARTNVAIIVGSPICVFSFNTVTTKGIAAFSSQAGTSRSHPLTKLSTLTLWQVYCYLLFSGFSGTLHPGQEPNQV